MKKILISFLLFFIFVLKVDFIYASDYISTTEDEVLLLAVYGKLDLIYEQKPENIDILNKKIILLLSELDGRNEYILNSIHLYIETLQKVEEDDENISENEEVSGFEDNELVILFIEILDEIKLIEEVVLENEYGDEYNNLKKEEGYNILKEAYISINNIEDDDLLDYIKDSGIKSNVYHEYLNYIAYMIDIYSETKYYWEFNSFYTEYISYNKVDFDNSDILKEKSKEVKGILYNREKSFKKIFYENSISTKYWLDKGEYEIKVTAIYNDDGWVSMVLRDERKDYIDLIINDTDVIGTKQYFYLEESGYYYFDFDKSSRISDDFYFKISEYEYLD